MGHKMHKSLLITIIGLVILGSVLTIIRVWWTILSWDFYIKAIITIAILVILLGFVMVLKIDLGQHKKLKDDNYLD